MSHLKLYSYFRSSSAYRVRIALYLKGQEFEYIPVHLIKDGGEQHSAEYKKLNPMENVPCLVHNDKVISESMAIITYLDRAFPEVPLFPKEVNNLTQVIQICEIVNSGIQPIQNLKVLQKLDSEFNIGPEGKKKWAHHWIQSGFQGLEAVLTHTSGQYALGDQVTAADLFIVPQVYNAHRFEVDMTAFPQIAKVHKNASELEAFKKSLPEVQIDAPQS